MSIRKPDFFKIVPTEGIVMDDLAVGTVIDFRDPKTLALRTQRIKSISKTGNIIIIDAVGETTRIGLKHVRKVY